jgi:hypothetical protein
MHQHADEPDSRMKRADHPGPGSGLAREVPLGGCAETMSGEAMMQKEIQWGV